MHALLFEIRELLQSLSNTRLVLQKGKRKFGRRENLFFRSPRMCSLHTSELIEKLCRYSKSKLCPVDKGEWRFCWAFSLDFGGIEWQSKIEFIQSVNRGALWRLIKLLSTRRDEARKDLTSALLFRILFLKSRHIPRV
jgi:hypothetical protein